MSKEDDFGFVHLEEESDDDSNFTSDGLGIELQPHLANSVRLRQQPNFNGIDNPAFPVEFGDDTQSSKQPRVIMEIPAAAPTGHAAASNPSPHDNVAVACNDSASSSSKNASSLMSPSDGLTVEGSNIKVHYNSSEGHVNVMQGQVVTAPNGTSYIDTQGIPQMWSELERPLRRRKMRFLKIFSIVSCFFFFPSGLVAVYYAFQTEKEFDEGILRGNIDRAQKFATRCERLIILTLLLSIVVAAVVLAIVEQPFPSDSHHLHNGVITG